MVCISIDDGENGWGIFGDPSALARRQHSTGPVQHLQVVSSAQTEVRTQIAYDRTKWNALQRLPFIA